MTRDPSLLLRCCVEAARAAGNYALENKPRRSEIHQRFSHDIKLKLDLESQACAFEVVQCHFPEDSILGEEGSRKTDGEYEWVIDPIDGTVNFFHGLNWWCSSVAVRRGKDIIAGAVYAPEQHMLFEAHADAESLLNGKPIRHSTVENLADALVVTGSEKEISLNRLPLATAQAIALDAGDER